MARSTRKSLAGQAASAARKVVGRRSTRSADEVATSATATKTATKTASARSAAPAAKSAPAKKAAKKASPAKTTPAKKAPAGKATPAKKAASTAKTAPVKKAAPAKKAVAEKKAAPAKKAAPTRSTAAKKSPPAKKAAHAKKTTPAKAVKKTTPTKKAPASALVVKEGEEAWTKAELAEVLAELHEQREHSARIVAEQEIELSGLMRDAGDGAGHDQADLGATSFERDHELTVLSNERDKLAQIERALGRIDDGTYGVCESCGNAIGKMRLMAFPRATLCMTCKQREERR
ncbi:hypothetical protein GCM10009844_37490 [Nocardioides koreensis]|uniref:Zinc finger DksA/TraR C4-type domain-containing protein n=1 Tax=Nocardioides koreensis TaxID=433651 RepID=A0ABN3A3K5_9ACTN